jgi:hypothetical protein
VLVCKKAVWVSYINYNSNKKLCLSYM